MAKVHFNDDPNQPPPRPQNQQQEESFSTHFLIEHTPVSTREEANLALIFIIVLLIMVSGLMFLVGGISFGSEPDPEPNIEAQVEARLRGEQEEPVF